MDMVVDLLERSDVNHQTLEEWVEQFLGNTLPTVVQNPSEATHVSEVAILDSTDASQYLSHSVSADSPKVEWLEDLLAPSPL
jgi:hypothetical protein